MRKGIGVKMLRDAAETIQSGSFEIDTQICCRDGVIVRKLALRRRIKLEGTTALMQRKGETEGCE